MPKPIQWRYSFARKFCRQRFQKVAITSTRAESFGMLIQSAEFSQTYGHLFEALWQVSAKP